MGCVSPRTGRTRPSCLRRHVFSLHYASSNFTLCIVEFYIMRRRFFLLERILLPRPFRSLLSCPALGTPPSRPQAQGCATPLRTGQRSGPSPCSPRCVEESSYIALFSLPCGPGTAGASQIPFCELRFFDSKPCECQLFDSNVEVLASLFLQLMYSQQAQDREAIDTKSAYGLQRAVHCTLEKLNFDVATLPPGATCGDPPAETALADTESMAAGPDRDNGLQVLSLLFFSSSCSVARVIQASFLPCALPLPAGRLGHSVA